MANPVGSKPSRVPAAEWAAVQRGIAAVSGKGLSVSQLQHAKPEQLGNDPVLERDWAIKAGRHAETYFNILKSLPDKRKIRLTKIDDELYADFRKTFPRLEVGVLDEDRLKAPAAKKQWAAFCERYKERNDQVSDYNFGTLLRLRASGEYGPDNSCIVVRVQFYAIEIARNREGKNDGLKK